MLALKEILLPDHQPPAQGEDLTDRLLEGDPAVPPVGPQLNSGEHSVAEVDEFLGFEREIRPCFDQALPHVAISVAAAMDPGKVGRQVAANLAFGQLELDCRIEAIQEHVEITTVRGCGCALSNPGEQQPTHRARCGSRSILSASRR